MTPSKQVVKGHWYFQHQIILNTGTEFKKNCNMKIEIKSPSPFYKDWEPPEDRLVSSYDL